MVVYQKYAAQLEPLVRDPSAKVPEIKLTEEEKVLIRTTRAGRILSSLGAEPDFERLYTAFVDGTGDLFWDPSGKGAYTAEKLAKILDGTLDAGECKLIAAAFLALWVLPPPFGLGKFGSNPAASLQVFNDNNVNDGFISYHPKEGVRELRPNIMHPHGTVTDLNTRQPLYQWGNHKVIAHNGRLWDPTYRRIWDGETDMVAFRFTGVTHPKDRDAYRVAVVNAAPEKGWLAGQLMYMRLDLVGGGWKGPYRDIA